MSFEKGNKLYNSQEFELAIQEYNKSIEQELEVERSYYNMGCAYIKIKDYNNAIICFKNALLFEKKNKYFYNMGVCYGHKEDYGSALFNLIIASELDDEDEDTKKAIKIVINRINNIK